MSVFVFPVVVLSGLCCITCVWPTALSCCFRGQQPCGTEQEQSNKTRAKKQLCASGSGSCGLCGRNRGEESKERCWGGLSRALSVCPVLVLLRRQGGVSSRGYIPLLHPSAGGAERGF